MTLVKVNNRPAYRNFNGLVNELFQDFEQSFGSFGNSRHTVPAVNIIETTEGFHAELLAPGRNKDLFALKVEDKQLTISYKAEAKATPQEWKQVRREFTTGDFSRTFMLDESIDAENIQAKYEDGLLKIFLPKKAEVKPAAKTIQIQ